MMLGSIAKRVSKRQLTRKLKYSKLQKKLNLRSNTLQNSKLILKRFYVTEKEVADKIERMAEDDLPEDVDALKREEHPGVLIEENEKTVGDTEKLEFQAETKKILDIVTRSLYTEREVFVRELISNASDALEKARSYQASNMLEDPELPFEINISVDPVKKTLTIQDYGIGMNKEELTEFLGKIGFSGTGEFVKLLEDKARATNYIGQFGVGFYSAFMVSNKVKVYSKSAKGGEGHVWESDGMGSYKLARAEGVKRGSKIILYLKDNCDEYSQYATIEQIIKKYSNFVGFNIALNGKQINTIRALWLEDKNKITAEEHKQFYQFISHGYDTPQFTLQFSTDSPLSIRALLYVPEYHTEKYGLSQIDHGVNIYCRKILISTKSKDLLPEWLRFIRGVVDSEDIPLNISREHLQDSSLIKRLGNVITTRIIKFLDAESKKDVEKYKKFYEEFGNFLKQGVCSDAVHKHDIAGLLRFETSTQTYTSLSEYVSRMPSTQNEIYYLSAPNKQLAESSPYIESFKEGGLEVLYLYNDIDDFVVNGLGDFQNKKLVSIESSQIQIPKKNKEDEKTENPETLKKEDFLDFSKWFKNVLADKVNSVKESERKLSTPCIIVDAESASVRRIMQMVQNKKSQIPKQTVEINSSHSVIVKLNELRKSNEDLAKVVVEQVFDNALLQAGLLDDGRVMVPRINKLLEIALKDGNKSN